MAAKTTPVCCLILLCLVFKANTVTADCPPGWFGNNCEYQCHCEGRCSPQGNCEFGCSKGWFGPACQYVDLVYTESTNSTHRYLLDADDNTCYPNLSDPTTVTLQEGFPFTWLRLHVKQPGALEFLQVSLIGDKGNKVRCWYRRRIAAVDNTTVDVQCITILKIQHVVLSGKGLSDLCSIYISGGRNLALRQNASQSSSLYSYSTASRAVDGDTTVCTLTDICDSQPQLSVNFRSNMVVNRYVLYNIPVPEWQGFALRSFRSDGFQTFNYVDKSGDPQPVHMVNLQLNKYVQVVEVEATQVTEGIKVLGLCELQIYGESLCPKGTYGRDCEHLCDCGESTNTCLVTTGACPTFCDTGLTEESCS